MPTTAPAHRERLAKLMDDRRKELRLNWQQVSESGGIPIKTLHAVRTGSRDIRDTTQAAIEDGLRWERGSVQAILDGGDPAPAVTTQPPRPATPVPPPGFLDPAGVSRVEPYFDRIWLRIRDLALRGVEDPTGAELFGDSDDAADWDSYRRRGLPVERRVWLLAGLQAYDPAAGERERGTGLARGHP